MGELDSYVDEMHAKFIMGIEDLANYDAYLETLDKYSVDKVTATYQAAYDRWLAIKK